MADFFKRWLLITKEFDDDIENSEFARDINEIDEIKPPSVSTPATSKQTDGPLSK